MNPIDFLRTLYFGDRYCTKIVMNGKKNEIEFHINLISRIRDKSGEWNYYSEEDIENGIIVFEGVEKIYLDKSGLIPNDEIYNIEANIISENKYEFIIETSHVHKTAQTTDLIIKIVSESLYLLDPSNPNKKIVD